MANIEYRPHCAKCGALINEKVTYKDIIVEDEMNMNYLYSIGIEINPWRCNNCGEIFDKIEIRMPEKEGEVQIR